MIERHEIPLFEYDATSPEVIPPAHEFGDCRFPKKCLFAFLGDTIHRYAEAKHAEKRCEFCTVSATYPIYVLEENGEEICLAQAPVGAPPASSMLDALIASGCRSILALGSCGVLEKLPENAFLVPTRALRDEGSSYHYLPASRYIELDSEVLATVESVLKTEGLPFVPCTSWTTDAFYRETKDMVAYRRSEGCLCVEMECAALAACARLRGAAFGQLLFTADSLACIHDYDARNFGRDAHEDALLLGLRILREM